MRAIVAAVDANPGQAFTVEELCSQAFPDVDCIAKNHRGAVIRAVHSIVKRRSDLTLEEGRRLGAPGPHLLILFREDHRLSAIRNLRDKQIWLRTGRTNDPSKGIGKRH